MTEQEDEDFRYGKSYLNDQWYKITEWEEVDEPDEGKQKVVAKQKKPVDREEVPQEAIDTIEEE